MQNAYSPPCDCRICPCCFPGKQKNWTTTTTLKQRLKVWSPALVSLHQAAMVRTNRLVSIILIFLFWTSKHPDVSFTDIQIQFWETFLVSFFVKSEQEKKTAIGNFHFFHDSYQLGRTVFLLFDRFNGTKNILKHPNMIHAYDLLLWKPQSFDISYIGVPNSQIGRKTSQSIPKTRYLFYCDDIGFLDYLFFWNTLM